MLASFVLGMCPVHVSLFVRAWWLFIPFHVFLSSYFHVLHLLCNVRCGLIWLQRARKVGLMLSKLMCFGMGMNQLEDRWKFLAENWQKLLSFCNLPLIINFLKHHFFFLVLLSVFLWRKIWYCQVCEASGSYWTLSSSSHRSLCVRWMEFWVWPSFSFYSFVVLFWL